MSNNTDKKPLIILTAGGTGGHVFPAESLAEELSQRGYELALVTDSRGKDNYHGKLGEIKNYSVLAGALVGKSKLFKIKSLFKTGLGTLQAIYIILKNKPTCVVGFGGYASFPCCMAAILLGIDLVIHEQNSVMSRTNRFLGKYATFIGKSFEKTKYIPARTKQILTGMPIRKNIATLYQRQYQPYNNNKQFQLLIIGGSQGAKVFSEIIPPAIKTLPKEQQKQLRIYHQCRKEDADNVSNSYNDCLAEITISHFFENMVELYNQASLIISRAGASSIAEITATRLPSVLIPLPTAADNHQATNAAAIETNQAGYVLAQKDLSVESLSTILQSLINDSEKRINMSERAARLSIIDASKRLADSIENEIIFADK